MSLIMAISYTQTHTHIHTHTHTNAHNMCTCLKSWQSVAWLARHSWRPLRTAHQIWMIWVTQTHTLTHTCTHTHKHTQHVHMSQIMAVSYMASKTPAHQVWMIWVTHARTHTRTCTHTHTHTHTHTYRPTTEVFLRMSPFPVQLKFDIRLAIARHPWRPLSTSGMDDLGYTHTDTHTHTHTHKHTQHVCMTQIMAVSCMCTYIGGRCGSAAGIVMILFTQSLWTFLFGGAII